MYEPDPGKMTSMEELEACEKQLETLLVSVTKRKVITFSVPFLLHSYWLDTSISTSFRKIFNQERYYNDIFLYYFMKMNLSSKVKASEEESNEADLLSYDDAFNQPQIFDYGTTSERYILV